MSAAMPEIADEPSRIGMRLQKPHTHNTRDSERWTGWIERMDGQTDEWMHHTSETMSRKFEFRRRFREAKLETFRPSQAKRRTATSHSLRVETSESAQKPADSCARRWPWSILILLFFLCWTQRCSPTVWTWRAQKTSREINAFLCDFPSWPDWPHRYPAGATLTNMRTHRGMQSPEFRRLRSHALNLDIVFHFTKGPSFSDRPQRYT